MLSRLKSDYEEYGVKVSAAKDVEVRMIFRADGFVPYA